MEYLIERYKVLLFDAYGVLVHTSGAMPGASELIRNLNQMPKPYYILTNDASKLPATAARRYQCYGLDIEPARILTSGGRIKEYFRLHGLTGARCIVLGTEDSNHYVDQAGGRIVAAGGEFDVLVVADEAGYPFLETIDQAFTSLCRLIDQKREVHLLLPNPDLVYPKADQGLGFTAGSIAVIFEAALKLRYPDRKDLRFSRLGKPGTGLYEEAFSRSGTGNMVMIGDQLETDIRGARNFGIDAAWIQTGIMGDAPGHIPSDTRPTYVMTSLQI